MAVFGSMGAAVGTCAGLGAGGLSMLWAAAAAVPPQAARAIRRMVVPCAAAVGSALPIAAANTVLLADGPGRIALALLSVGEAVAFAGLYALVLAALRTRKLRAAESASFPHTPSHTAAVTTGER